MASIAEISRRTGFSTATVSRALDPRLSGKVRLQTREKIRRACDELGFQPQFAARSLAAGKTFSIGILMPWASTIFTSPTYGRLMNLLTVELQKRGYTLTLISLSSADAETIYRETLDIVQSNRVDGLLSLSVFMSEALLEKIQARKLPLVTFSMPSDPVQSFPGANNIRIDEKPAIAELMGHLRRRGAVAQLFSSQEGPRYQLLSKLCDAHFKTGRDLFSRYDNAAAAMQLVRKKWDELQCYPVWWAQNDHIAYGASEVIREHGLTPGRDIALAGFDDIEAELENPFFTTIRPPHEKVAAECVHHILEATVPEVPVQIVIPAELIIRPSTQCRIEKTSPNQP